MSIISLKAIEKKFGKVTALNNVSLDIETGESFALLGPNGAGKTSIIRILLGFTKQDSGTASINGISCSDIEARRGIGYLPENLRIPPFLSGREFLKRNAELFQMTRMDADKAIDNVLEITGMKERANERTANYSKGMFQRIGLAASLLNTPKLLILDEPTNGLDPIGMREFRLILERLKVDKVTILLNSHILSEVERICSSAAIMNKGSIVVKDTIENLVRDGESLEDVFVRVVSGPALPN
ncbi:MAG: ABC transporter ATP-binding protein [Fibrobacter sp.]|nr:ABC transporter ATP-binding protein [Fibrobacter sp.]